MKKGLVGLLLFAVICIAACHKTTITPTISQQFTTDSLKIVKYLADNNIQATEHDSVWYSISTLGTGAYPTRYNCVLVKYSVYELGTDTAFQTFDNPGIKAPLKGFNGVVGLQIALKKFPAGTKATVFIPSYLAYGTGGQRNPDGSWVVHPNTCLIFDIELVQLFDYNVAGNYCYE